MWIGNPNGLWEEYMSISYGYCGFSNWSLGDFLKKTRGDKLSWLCNPRHPCIVQFCQNSIWLFLKLSGLLNSEQISFSLFKSLSFNFVFAELPSLTITFLHLMWYEGICLLSSSWSHNIVVYLTHYHLEFVLEFRLFWRVTARAHQHVWKYSWYTPIQAADWFLLGCNSTFQRDCSLAIGKPEQAIKLRICMQITYIQLRTDYLNEKIGFTQFTNRTRSIMKIPS